MIKRLGYLFFLIILRNKIVIVKNFSRFSNINIIDLYFKSCNLHYQCQAVYAFYNYIKIKTNM